MSDTFRPQAWHVEVRGSDEPVVIAAFATRFVAEEYRDEHNAEAAQFGQSGGAYVCLCDCPERKCLHLLEVGL